MPSLPLTLSRATIARIYTLGITAAGLTVLGVFSVLVGPQLVEDADALVVLLVLAVVFGELSPIDLGPERGELTPSTTFVFALFLFSGVGAAMLAQAAGCLVADVIHGRRRDRIAFNVAQYALSLGAAGALFHLLADPPDAGLFSARQLLALLAAGIAYFVINTGAVALAIALSRGQRLRDQITGDLARQSATEGILLGLTPLTVLAMEVNPILIPLLTLPLLSVVRAVRDAQRAEHLSLHDALTGLPNRTLFRDNAAEAVAAADCAPLAVMIIDLDHFKEINDTLGHHSGDEVLRQLADRLTGIVEPTDTVARLGGDEFAVILRSATDVDDGVRAARVICAELARPVTVDEAELDIGASIGLAWHPADGDDVPTLMRHADIAMYAAKTNRTGVERYSARHDEHSVARLNLAGDLRRGIDGGELVAHFQPKIDLRSGELRGAEALVRWLRPGRPPVEPDLFIGLAEHTGLIVGLTMCVIEQAAQACVRWRTLGLCSSVSVNLSARLLEDPGLPDRVQAACRRHGLEPGAMVLEITESTVVANPVLTLAVLEGLVDAGFGISIDDFGTGYSSFDHLKRLPVAEVKLDRSFVTDMADDDDDAAIVRFAIQLGDSLGLRVVAEGVETIDVEQRLVELGCDEAQGFLYSPALAPGAFIDWALARAGAGERRVPAVAKT